MKLHRLSSILFVPLLLAYVSVALAVLGIDWQTVNPKNSAPSIGKVIWQTSQYVSVGPAGDIQTSLDGTIWAPSVSNTTNALGDIVWGGTQFVAVGIGGTIVTSPDAVTWTVQNSNSTDQLNSVAWDGTQFVVVGGAVIDPNPFSPVLSQIGIDES